MTKGFTIVELMVTLGVAGLFLLSGFQLYQVVQARNAEAREMSEASNIAYTVLRKQPAPSTNAVCNASTPSSTPSGVPSHTLPQPVRVKLYRCLPYNGAGVVKMWVTVEYGRNGGSVTHATYLPRP